MRDILHGLFVEMPVSIAANLPWAPILLVLAIFFFLKAIDFSFTDFLEGFFL
ncbi:hypothetical protein H6761_03555 [Candidatus Nomurabacteria bacterium]|nr:hypothetical protein [Candidatus Nomurabacteria bacterium]